MTEDNILLSFAHDRMSKCINDYVITSTSFLDVRQQSLVLSEFSKNHEAKTILYGGYDTAERLVAVFVPYYFEDGLNDYFLENPDENPLTVIRFKKDSFSQAGHRDYLGALMGLGIKRETIGDISVTEKGADIVVLKSIASFIMSEMKSAGRATLHAEEISFSEMNYSVSSSKEITINVSSMRLDNIISACYKLSRSDSADAILSGSIFVNSLQALKCDKKVSKGDKIVFRTKGKAVIKEIAGTSKKGRIFLKIDIYN
ncbi:MAG: hypothetical protein E7536_00085 [Ruminococcaceae bacterium]|nr:hypothetical protein [Oscillospiraceae bacterium]